MMSDTQGNAPSGTYVAGRSVLGPPVDEPACWLTRRDCQVMLDGEGESVEWAWIHTFIGCLVAFGLSAITLFATGYFTWEAGKVELGVAVVAALHATGVLAAVFLIVVLSTRVRRRRGRSSYQAVRDRLAQYAHDD
jgi:hypothetical protein